jgi:hypothetical protein
LQFFYFFPDPNTFLLDHLLQLKPVKFLEGELIHDLLTIFVSQKLEAYTRFYDSHRQCVQRIRHSWFQNESGWGGGDSEFYLTADPDPDLGCRNT